jgi:hypothetical protein
MVVGAWAATDGCWSQIKSAGQPSVFGIDNADITLSAHRQRPRVVELPLERTSPSSDLIRIAD